MAYVEVDIDLEKIDDQDLLDEIEDRIKYYDDFANSVKEILEQKANKKIYVLESEILSNLSNLPNWENRCYAKEYFESLPFGESLKQWILQTYKGDMQ